MRRDGRRKTSKRKSYEAEHHKSEALPEHPTVNGDDVKTSTNQVKDENEDQVENTEEMAEASKNAPSLPEKTEDDDKTLEELDKKDVKDEVQKEDVSIADEQDQTNISTSQKSIENDNADDSSLLSKEPNPELNDENLTKVKDDDDGVDDNEDKEEKFLTKATNEAALRLYSSINHLALQALLSVKQEPTPDVQLPERYLQSFLSTLNGSYFNHDDAIQSFSMENKIENDSSFARMLRPPAELTPEALAKQLRYSDLASMVVCRRNNGKIVNGSSDSVPSGISKVGNSVGGQGTGPGSGLHQFVTRYTIERPEDPTKSGIEICLAGDDPLDPIMEVECGGNKGMLYVSKLCQGSKGQSILFNDEWLTPNEFQFISGRETAKDWKRSIRHCGKSLKTLMTKGILQVHPPVCECDYCKGHGPATVEKSKKRAFGQDHDRQLSIPETMRSGGSTTPSSSDSTTPLPSVIPEAPTITLHKPGREGGLSSIISQLRNKRSIGGNDVKTETGEGSLDLTIRSSSSTSPIVNGRKRPRETGHQQCGENNNLSEDIYLPAKRQYSNEEDSLERYSVSTISDFNRSDSNDHHKSPKSTNSEPLCLSSSNRKQARDFVHSNSTGNRDGRDSSHSYNGVEESSEHKYLDTTSTPPGASVPSIYNEFYKSSNQKVNVNYNPRAFMDAMRRAVLDVTANAYSEHVHNQSSSTSKNLSSGSSSGRQGFINLDSTSRRFEIPSPGNHSSKNQPMVKFPSHRRMNGNRLFSDQNDREQRKNVYHNLDHFKPPVTVLHHRSNQFENPFLSSHRQSSSRTGNPYSMPPPFSHGSLSDRKFMSRSANDRFRHATSASRSKNGKAKVGSRKSDNPKRSEHEGNMPMLNLQNHAIPMLSLTYSNKKSEFFPTENARKDSSFCGSDNMHQAKRSQSALGAERRNCISRQRKAASDDEIGRNDDILRRQSSSAPPPLFESSINGFKGLDENNNEKINKDLKDDVFGGLTRAKSASPNAPRSHPYSRDPRSSSSIDANRPDSNLSCFQESFEGSPTWMQQYEMLRFRDMCAALEDMGDWTVNDVSKFLENIGCDQYQEVFRENGIDGDALPLLMEHHLVNKMGMKLGHALKVIARVQRRLGNHCALIRDRLDLSHLSMRASLSTFNSLSAFSDRASPPHRSVAVKSPSQRNEMDKEQKKD